MHLHGHVTSHCFAIRRGSDDNPGHHATLYVELVVLIPIGRDKTLMASLWRFCDRCLTTLHVYYGTYMVTVYSTYPGGVVSDDITVFSNAACCRLTWKPIHSEHGPIHPVLTTDFQTFKFYFHFFQSCNWNTNSIIESTHTCFLGIVLT